MICTVTFNPAIDKTAVVDELIPGGLNRLQDVRSDAGGKGINVSKTIRALGGSSICTGFLAGNPGEFIRKSLNDLGIAHDFIQVEGETRTNLKVLNRDMELTELNEPGPTISADDVDRLVDTILRQADAQSLVVLSGNVSPGVSADVYQKIIEALKNKNIRTILDADGDLFRYGIQARPTVIKPNRFELAQYFGKEENLSNEEVIALARTFLNEETRLVVVSMGTDGSIFLNEQETWIAPALKVDFRSAVGAGDAMVAAIACGLDQNLPLPQIIRLAVATSAGACLSAGTAPASLDTVRELEKQVEIRKG